MNGCQSLKYLSTPVVNIGDDFGAHGLYSLKRADLKSLKNVGDRFCETGCDNLETIVVSRIEPLFDIGTGLTMMMANYDLNICVKFAALVDRDGGINVTTEVDTYNCHLDAQLECECIQL
jgi:hypothetical protein